jgi:hypothetical protein
MDAFDRFDTFDIYAWFDRVDVFCGFDTFRRGSTLFDRLDGGGSA